MKKIYKKLLIKIIHSKTWRCLLIKIIPFIRFSMYYAKIRGHQYAFGYSKLKSGDIILSVDKKKLTSLLVPGIFTHAAFCVYKGHFPSFYEVAEMTHNNFTESYFFDICKEADRVVILRCTDFDLNYTNQVISKCRSLSASQYDVEFNLGIEALYCSELIYQSDFEHRLDLNLDDIHSLGTKYISPDGIYFAKNIKVIWDSEG